MKSKDEVYKELDYATNFAANGTGEWKDSGLGEAKLMRFWCSYQILLPV